MITELINPEDLEPGDVVLYPSLTEIRTAKIVKTPTKITKTYTYGQYSYYKSARCLVNVQSEPIPGYKMIRRVQKFSFDEFNETKYIRFSNPVLKVIDK
jgi:hypothetical protein